MRSSLREPLWTKNFLVISTINFCILLIFFLLIVTIAEYAVDKLGASTSMAGLVSSIYVIGALLGRLLSGRFILLMGSKLTFFGGLAFFIITTLCYFIAVNLPLLVIIRLLHGIAAGIIGTAIGTIIAQLIPLTRRGEGISYFSMSITLATAIGPFVGMLLIQIFENFNIIFLFNTILVTICITLSLLLKFDEHHKSVPSNTSEKKSGFSIRNYIEPKAIPISVIALLTGFAYAGVMSFLSFYSKEIKLVEAGSVFFLVFAITVLATRPFTGPLMDRRGANIIIYPALILFSLGMILFSQASTSFIFLLSACIIGLGYGNFTSIAQAIAIKGINTERLGLATTTYYILYDLGLGLGPFVLGYFVPLMGYRFSFLATVPIIIFSIIIYAKFVGRKEVKEIKDVAKIKMG